MEDRTFAGAPSTGSLYEAGPRKPYNWVEDEAHVYFRMNKELEEEELKLINYKEWMWMEEMMVDKVKQ